MSEKQLNAFMKKVMADPTLQNQLKNAASPDSVAAIAEAAGFSISANDLGKEQAIISDREMESVAGGGGDCSMFKTQWGSTMINFIPC